MFERKSDLEEFMTGYYKSGSSRPDFLEELPSKINHIDSRKNPEYLFGILYIIKNVSSDKKELIVDKLLEELVIQIVELHKK